MSLDSRSLKNIGTLHPTFQPWAKAHLEAVNKLEKLPKGWRFKITSGTRTFAEQNALFAEGRRGIPGEDKVTDARGGFSWHNFEIAYDLTLFDEVDKPVWESPLYDEAVKVGRKMGLDCGADWKSFKDRPHYQAKTGLSIKQAREYVALGKPLPIPVFGEPLDDPKPEEAKQPVKVLDNGSETQVKAYVEDERTWVALRAFCHQFGGTVDQWKRVSAEVSFAGQKLTIPAVLGSDGNGYVKFADLNRLFGWPYSYRARTLNILDDEGSK